MWGGGKTRFFPHPKESRYNLLLVLSWKTKPAFSLSCVTVSSQSRCPEARRRWHCARLKTVLIYVWLFNFGSPASLSGSGARHGLVLLVGVCSRFCVDQSFILKSMNQYLETERNWFWLKTFIQVLLPIRRSTRVLPWPPWIQVFVIWITYCKYVVLITSCNREDFSNINSTDTFLVVVLFLIVV